MELPSKVFIQMAKDEEGPYTISFTDPDIIPILEGDVGVYMLVSVVDSSDLIKDQEIPKC